MCSRNVTSEIVVLVVFIRSVLAFKTQRSADKLRTGHAALSVPHPLHQPLPSPITTKPSDRNRFIILQCNANGIRNKQVELGEFLERHKVKVAVTQESKLTLNFRTSNIQNLTTVIKYRTQYQGGGLLT